MRSFGEVPGWNGLRGVAVLIVFVAHMDVILPIPTLLVIPGATVSLDSFFVLSGFLITALLLKEQARHGKIGIGPFYRRRALRLLPALYVVVLANALFAYFSHAVAAHRSAIDLFRALLLFELLLRFCGRSLQPEACLGIPAPVVVVVRRAVLFHLAVVDDRTSHDPHAPEDGRHHSRSH